MNCPEDVIKSDERTSLKDQNIYFSVEEYKRFVSNLKIKKDQEILKNKATRGAAILEQRKRKIHLQEKNNCDVLSIKEEPGISNSGDLEQNNDGNLNYINTSSDQSNQQRVKFVIETEGDIDKITKDFLSSLGENSSNFNMKVRIGNFKFEICNDS